MSMRMGMRMGMRVLVHVNATSAASSMAVVRVVSRCHLRLGLVRARAILGIFAVWTVVSGLKTLAGDIPQYL
jgi:hypothetical protein